MQPTRARDCCRLQQWRWQTTALSRQTFRQCDLTPGDLRADLSPSVLPWSVSLPAEENSPCGSWHLRAWESGWAGTGGLEAEWHRLSFMDRRFTTVPISLPGNFLGSPEPFPMAGCSVTRREQMLFHSCLELPQEQQLTGSQGRLGLEIEDKRTNFISH